MSRKGRIWKYRCWGILPPLDRLVSATHSLNEHLRPANPGNGFEIAEMDTSLRHSRCRNRSRTRPGVFRSRFSGNVSHRGKAIRNPGSHRFCCGGALSGGGSHLPASAACQAGVFVTHVFGTLKLSPSNSSRQIKKRLTFQSGASVLVGSARFELATYGLRVRCSTS